MKYDFTSIMERKGQDAIAVDGLGTMPGLAPDLPDTGFDVIPMWVADMNFPACPTITQAIIGRAKIPHFGYFDPRQEYFDLILQWHKKRNGVSDMTADCIGYENGVLGGMLTALNVMCSKGDRVLIHSPAYAGFTECLEDNGYNMIFSSLKLDAQGIYRMDFEDMEKKIAENKIHAAVFCSPHNPAGRVWEREELEQFMALCEKYDVFVVSDEIWSDIICPGYTHIPTQSISAYAKSHTVALYAPSKTFNLAGLMGSYHVIYDKWLRDRIDREGNLSMYNHMNVLSMYALIGAYQPEGYEWVDELRQVIAENINYACDYIRKQFKGVSAAQPQGTYMLFIDCTQWCKEHKKTIQDVEKMCWRVGVAVQDGVMFHGPCHIRMNLALPLSRVKEAFERLDKYVFNA